jgi:urease accessory protein
MLQGLGLNVTVEQAPFEPEAGAYHADAESADSHSHSHSHPHGHGHGH